MFDISEALTHDIDNLQNNQERLSRYSGKGVRATRLAALKNDIEKHLGHSQLSAGWIAARAGISPRYMRDLFALEETNFTEYVLDRRLKRVWQQLRRPLFARRTISSIAYDAGFNDLSYFTRAFKRKFSVTPREIRNTSSTQRVKLM